MKLSVFIQCCQEMMAEHGDLNIMNHRYDDVTGVSWDKEDGWYFVEFE